MPTRLAILAAAAVATAGGDVPGTHACVNRRSIPHLHTPCSPNRHIGEQIDAATKGAQAAVGPPHPLGTHPSILNLTDGWQTTTVERIAGPATKVFPQDEHWSMPGSELTHLHELTISAITKEKTKAS